MVVDNHDDDDHKETKKVTHFFGNLHLLDTHQIEKMEKQKYSV